MNVLVANRGRALAALLVLLGVVALSGTATAQEPASLNEKISECMGHYVYGRFDEGIAAADKLLKRSDLTAQDSVAVYEALSILNYAKGEQYLRRSVDYLNKISQVGPCVIQLPRELWPPELRTKWFEITNGTDAFTCATEIRTGVKTIAIMEFDNFSVQKFQDKLGPIGKGLADWFEHDFGKISSLTVVERDKINFVLQELELQRSGAVDKSTAVQAGKVLGAQYMVFGSITQLDDKHTGMVVRVVSVETSEIIASVDKRDKPDYSRLEQELVVELAEKLDIMLDDDVKKMIEEGGTESLDATTLYAKGLEYSDRYDYKQAYEYFKKAYELDPNFTEAKQKMDILHPLAS
jgi:tetratricopeptide (TPR) repeat protein